MDTAKIMIQMSGGSIRSHRGVRVFLAGFLVLWACAAQAATMDFNDHIGGADLGNGAVATLDATAVAGGVEISLTNTGAYDAIIGRLAISYTGQSDIHLAATPDESGLRSWNDGRSPIDIDTGMFGSINLGFWGANNPLALIRPGQSLTFTLLGATMDELFGGRRGAILNVLTEDGGRSLYGAAAPAVVPLPAAGLMLLGALGILGMARRRRAA